jgi:pimeloyl-ACP methyl ester carboxylesterase
MSTPTLFKSAEGSKQYLAAYATALARWPVPHQELQVKTSFGITHVNAAGAANLPPLLLLHAFGLSSTAWFNNIAGLSQNYRVYAPDVIDQPGKSVRTIPALARPDYAAWQAELLDGLKIDHCSLIGHSFGGWLAINFALATPARIDRLALLSPAASFAPLVPQFYLRGMLANLIPVRRLVFSMLQWMSYAPVDPAGPDVEQFLMAVRYFNLTHLKPPTVYSDEELRCLRMPVLLLIGEHEVIYQADQVLERARRLLPQVETGRIAGGGHAFPAELPAATNARLLKFLTTDQ